MNRANVCWCLPTTSWCCCCFRVSGKVHVQKQFDLLHFQLDSFPSFFSIIFHVNSVFCRQSASACTPKSVRVSVRLQTLCGTRTKKRNYYILSRHLYNFRNLSFAMILRGIEISRAQGYAEKKLNFVLIRWKFLWIFVLFVCSNSVGWNSVTEINKKTTQPLRRM